MSGTAATAPRRFLLGVVCGLLACALAGRWFAAHPLADDGFVRLHRYTAAETNFFPTASQLLATVEARCARDQTVVLVGGNSVFNGYGQPPERIWTARLEALLGPSFCVVNLATAFSLPGDIPSVMLNVLWNRYPRVLLVANAIPATCGPPGGARPFRYLFWDAYWKGLLAFPDDARVAVDATPEPDDDERRLHGALDAVFFFDDLWTAIGYRWVFSAWSLQTTDSIFRARRFYPDPVPPLPPRGARLAPRQVQRWSSALFADQGGGWVERPEPWEQFERETHAVMPPALRERTLMVTVDVNPAVRAALPPRDADRHARMLAGTLQRWRAAGYHSVITGRDFTAADYLDVTHLTPSGGDKLAAAVAPAVRRLTSPLGRENQ